ncbi:MAG: hypothetical protein K9H26_09890 [Prolixibacteraceae bacterium]|nr:hypothetical protein [Prolixibacteraceae bacterium]
MKRFCNFLLISFFVSFGLISRATVITHHVRFEPDLKIASQTADDGNLYSTVSLAGYKMDLTEGAPQLPVKYIKLIIPAGEEPDYLEYSKGKGETELLKEFIIPVQKPIPTSTEFTGNEFVGPDKQIYNSDSFYPGERVRLLRTDCVRGNKIVSLAVSPICYNPVKGQVEFVTDIDITLYLKNSDKKLLTAPVRCKEQFDNYLKSLVDNDEDVEKYSVIEQKQASGEVIDMKSTKSTSGISINCDYVIITPSSLSSYFNDFIQWKRQKGIDIELVTTQAISSAYTGDDISGINDEAGKIRQFLYEAYQNGLEYALLGGDGSTVPFRYGTGSNNDWDWRVANDYKIPADIYFSDFDGDWDVDSDQYLGESSNDDVDYGAEILVGRLLCDGGSEITDWINKVEWYETNPGNGSTSYLRKAFYTQADDMQGLDQASDIVSRFNGFFTTNTVFEEEYNGVPNHNSAESPQFPTGNDVVSEICDGYGFVSWFNHGSPNNVAVATKGLNDCGTNDKKKVTNYDNVQGWCGYVESDNGMEDIYTGSSPFILYTIACETTPFDTWNSVSPTDNLGARFTNQQSRCGPVYIGNTRYGWVSPSWYLQQDFTELLEDGTYRLGTAMADSKVSYSNHYLSLSQNLMGCPEIEIWSATPSQFSSAYITDGGSSVYVNTGGVNNCTISMISSTDFGASYQTVYTGVSQATFYSVPANYIVTITKHNYIPELFD